MPKLFFLKIHKKIRCSTEKTGVAFYLTTNWESFPKCAKKQFKKNTQNPILDIFKMSKIQKCSDFCTTFYEFLFFSAFFSVNLNCNIIL